MSPTDNSTLLKAIQGLGDDPISETERNEAILALRTTLRKLESPWQIMQGLVWENSAHAAALKIAHDLSLFKTWAASSEEVMDVSQLSKVVRSCDSALLDRVLRALSYKGTIDSPVPNKYKINAFSRSLAEPTMAACLDYWFNFQIPALTALPEYVASTDYKFPSDPGSTAWNFAKKDSTPFFGWLQQRPDQMAVFASVMQRYSSEQPAWVSLYPAEKLLQESSSGPILVDLGGGLGHDVIKFVNKFQPNAGSCYLQDRPEVLEKAAVPDQVVKQPIDFFADAPVKGARAYYLHSVLHDWSDDQCKTILSNIKKSMDRNVSKILIHELIRLEDGSKDLVSLREFTVMSILGAPERSEQQWKDLIAAAGLKVTAIYSSPLSLHSILEVESS